MAKRNKSKLKKRKQRQLKKAFKYSENHSEKKVIEKPALENVYLPPYKEPYEGNSYTVKKLEEGNKLYQSALDKVYFGKVIPLVNYTNPKCTILHKCSECGSEFFGKPGWLLTKENQKHVCGINGVNLIKKYHKNHKPIKINPKPTPLELSDKEKQGLCKLFKSGMSKAKISRYFDISVYMVNKYLKEAGA